MKHQKMKISGFMLAGIIIIATLFYTVEIQPVATGDLQGSSDTQLTNNQHMNQYRTILDILLTKSPFILPWLLFHKKTPTYQLNTFSSYDNLSHFSKITLRYPTINTSIMLENFQHLKE